MLRDLSPAAPGNVRLNPDVPGGGALAHPDDHVHGHEHHSLEAPHVHDPNEVHPHGDHLHTDHGADAPPEAQAPTAPSRAVVINVSEHVGALVLASNAQRSGTEVEIHPVSRPEARTHVWVLPREGRDGVVYAAIFPSLDSGDYAVLDVDGSICEVVSVLGNQVTHATWM